MLNRLKNRRNLNGLLGARDMKGLVLLRRCSFIVSKNRSEAEPGMARPSAQQKSKRYLRIIYLVVTFILLQAACSIRKTAMYELPEEMLPHVKTEFTKRCDKGQRLYLMSCAKCHNQKVKRKLVIPEWSSNQLSGYLLRTSNRQHETNMPDSLVTEEELGIIMTFLEYRKREGN